MKINEYIVNGITGENKKSILKWFANILCIFFPLRPAQTLYSTKLHAGNADAEGKAKIEPFTNSLIKRFNECYSKELSTILHSKCNRH